MSVLRLGSRVLVLSCLAWIAATPMEAAAGKRTSAPVHSSGKGRVQRAKRSLSQVRERLRKPGVRNRLARLRGARRTRGVKRRLESIGWTADRIAWRTGRLTLIAGVMATAGHLLYRAALVEWFTGHGVWEGFLSGSLPAVAVVATDTVAVGLSAVTLVAGEVRHHFLRWGSRHR